MNRCRPENLEPGLVVVRFLPPGITNARDLDDTMGALKQLSQSNRCVVIDLSDTTDCMDGTFTSLLAVKHCAFEWHGDKALLLCGYRPQLQRRGAIHMPTNFDMADTREEAIETCRHVLAACAV